MNNLRYSLFFLTLLLTSMIAGAATFVDGDLVYETISENEVRIYKLNRLYVTEVTIPETVINDGHTYKVVEIGDNAFNVKVGFSTPNVETLTIPSSVTKIGNYAFTNCYELKEITIPNSVTSIGQSAFWNCYSLHSVSLPNFISEIKDSLFWQCSSLRSIEIPNSVNTIGKDAFWGCSSLVTIDLPNSLKSIGENAFRGCSLLEEVTIPDSVTSMENEAFAGCEALRSVTLSNSMTRICQSAFYGCTALTSITIPTTINIIDKYAFSGCSSLTSIILPDGLKQIQERAFWNCSSLKTVYIPDSPLELYSNVFAGCSSLESFIVAANNSYFCLDDGVLLNKEKTTVIRCPQTKKGSYSIPNSVQYIEDYSFEGCESINSIIIPNSVLRINRDAFSNCRSIESIILPNSLDYIGDSAFFGCSSLTSIMVPKSVTSMANSVQGYPFRNCSSLQSINVDKENEFFSSNDGVLYNKTQTQLFQYPCGKSGEFKVPTTVTTIMPYAFTCSNLLKSIDLPGSLQKIGSSAFHSCENLKSVTCRALVPPQLEGTGVFYGINAQADLKVHDLAINEYKDSNWNTYFNKITTYCTPVTLSVQNLAPTTLDAYINVDLDDESLYNEVIKIYVGENLMCEVKGKSLAVDGLIPNTKHTLEYCVTSNTSFTTSKSFEVTTPSLELTTLQPQGVTETISVVSAETNLSETESHAGFQWKKYDAPESLNPKEAYAPVIDGFINGVIENLQPTTYYNVRAFYKANDGTYYFGDWVTFDPSDFSFFEPTIRTYDAFNVSSSSATVKGYVLRGSEEIIKQGFEYWPEGDYMNRIKSTVDKKEEKSIIEVNNSQLMTATLNNLVPSTTYCFRAFVTTASGEKYGDEYSFTTDENSGVASIEIVDDNIIGYYDIHGVSHSNPVKGFNIVRYSSGKISKMIIK